MLHLAEAIISSENQKESTLEHCMPMLLSFHFHGQAAGWWVHFCIQRRLKPLQQSGVPPMRSQDNAPVTRGVVVTSAIFTVFSGARGRSVKLGLSYEDIFKKFHLGKLISSSFAFSSTPELMCGLYLLYYFRVFERQIGSNKYTVFILFSLTVATLFEIIYLGWLKDPAFGAMASGPYGLIFSSFVPFYFDIPLSTRFRIFRFPFSDKSFIYLAGLQLIFSSWKWSLLPGICGVLAGLLYRLNLFYIRKIKFPRAVASFFSRLPWSSHGGSSSTISLGNVPGNATSNVGRRVEGNYPPSATFGPVIESSEDSISTLESMGFDRGAARQALIQARNDLNVATNMLLEAQAPS